SVRGSSNSHVAILARAMGVPCVMGVFDLPFGQLEGRRLVVDGYNGQIYASPSAELLSFYKSIVEEERQLVKGLEKLRDLPCETNDGHRMKLWVNTGLLTDVVRSMCYGAAGVGHFGAAAPFMITERCPREQDPRAS